MERKYKEKKGNDFIDNREKLTPLLYEELKKLNVFQSSIQKYLIEQTNKLDKNIDAHQNIAKIL